jgi:hypothetical protein
MGSAIFVGIDTDGFGKTEPQLLNLYGQYLDPRQVRLTMMCQWHKLLTCQSNLNVQPARAFFALTKPQAVNGQGAPTANPLT